MNGFLIDRTPYPGRKVLDRGSGSATLVGNDLKLTI
jgi:hypothetical protein